MGLAHDILVFLRTAGLIDGASGFVGFTYQLPPSNPGLSGKLASQTVVITPDGGPPPSAGVGPGRAGVEYPCFQVLVRAHTEDIPTALNQIVAIDAALRPRNAPGSFVTGQGSIYCWIKARQSEPFFLPYDDQSKRPRFTWNYDIGRSNF